MEHRLTVSVEAEQNVLGAMMLTGRHLDEVQDILKETDFYRQDHRLIYRTMCDLDMHDSPLDFLTLSEAMKSSGSLAKVGGAHYLGELANNATSAVNVVAYAKIVRDRSIRREILQAANVMRTLSEEDGEIEELISSAQTEVLGIGSNEAEGGLRLLKHWIPGWIDRLDDQATSGSQIAGLKSGFTDLDKKISGLQPGNLIVIAGRPSMGKTALAMNIAQHVSMVELQTTLVFSLEMSGNEIVTRMASQVGRVPMERLQSGDIDEAQWGSLNKAMAAMTSKGYLQVDDSPGLMMSQIRTRSRRAKALSPNGVGLIIIDYLQLMGMNGKTDNRAMQIGEVTRGLKGLAKELEVPIILLSQLNRDVEKRENRRPRLSDLKESGAIEQDADSVLFIYRDVVYNEHTIYKNVAEIIVGKQRNGPTGTVLMNYFGEYTQFASLDTGSQQAFWESKSNGRQAAKRPAGFDDDRF